MRKRELSDASSSFTGDAAEPHYVGHRDRLRERLREGGGDAFSDWQVAATAQIVRYCYAKYPNLKHVISHARLDPQRRNDPGPNFPWDTFKQLVLGAQAPLSTLITAIPRSVAENGSALDHFKTATLAEEEANFKIRENVHTRSLHK